MFCHIYLIQIQLETTGPVGISLYNLNNLGPGSSPTQKRSYLCYTWNDSTNFPWHPYSCLYVQVESLLLFKEF